MESVTQTGTHCVLYFIPLHKSVIRNVHYDRLTSCLRSPLPYCWHVVVRAAWLRWSVSPGSRPRLAGSLWQVIAVYALRLNSRAGIEGSTVSSLICDRWLILGLEMLSISRCLNHWNRWPPAVWLAGHHHQWLCSHAPLHWTLGPTVRGAHELWCTC